jgi:hypothetical protein
MCLNVAYATQSTDKLATSKEKITAQLRTFGLKFFSEEAVNKIFPVPVKPALIMPALPQLKSNNKSTATLDANSPLALQGASYFSLELDKRRGFEVAFIEEVYMATRRASPTDEDILKWLNSLEQGASREGVYRALVLDSVYASLEDFTEPVAPSILNFTQTFYQKYIGAQIDLEALKQLNTYTIKKVVAEKALEMMEAIENNPQDLYTWYSIMAKDLAVTYGKFFNSNKMRTAENEETHLSWAQAVPYQHLKSEMVVKIHLIYNGLADQASK